MLPRIWQLIPVRAGVMPLAELWAFDAGSGNSALARGLEAASASAQKANSVTQTVRTATIAGSQVPAKNLEPVGAFGASRKFAS
jgi:hypothetical protein